MTVIMEMELNHLTEDERDRILNVLRKDDLLKQKDAERIRKLKTELKRIRLRGVIKAGMDPDKTCARCRESFGWIFNKGAVCPQCQHKVCEKCRENMIRDPSKWLCVLCHKQMELDAMSGQWFMQKFRRSKRNRRTNKVITGQDMVKASIHRHAETDGKQTNGHSPGAVRKAETSSLTESETGSTTAPISERSSSREHKTSISSVPSINVTQHENQSQQESPESERKAADRSIESEGANSSYEETDDVDPVLAKHTSPTHSVHSQRSTGLLSPFSGSKESIVSFYSDAGEGNYGNIPITGDILFGIEYNYKTGSLEVKIKQCRDLATVDTRKKRSDPYVKVYLLPDKTKSGKRKTRVKKHTLNPVFEEVLKYAITKSELETRTLWVTVWHSDMFGRNDFLGEVTVPLDYYAFDEHHPQWYKLQERNASPMSLLTYKGDLIMSLKYVTSDNASSNKFGGNKKRTGRGELHILIKEARNLTAVRANGFSDPFCKGYLLPDKTMKQKTPVVKRDCNPQWNHTLVFEEMALDDLKDRSLELSVWDHDRFTSNDFLGGLRLNLGSGKIQGKEVDWMDSRGEEVSMWQSMLDRPNTWIDGSLMLRPNMAKRK